MNSKKLDKLLDNLTSGLDGDLEVQLDVRNELQAHLEDKIAAGEESGLSESESIEEAIKSFGDTIAVSDGLIEANFARMKFKARLRRVAMIILIPAVILGALGSLDGVWIIKMVTGQNLNSLITGGYTPEERLILHGDTTCRNLVGGQKAIMDHFPNDKVYTANYILALISSGRNKQDKAWADKAIKALGSAEKVDPDNALYNYLHAAILIKQGCSWDKKRLKKRKSGQVQYKYRIKIKDSKLMNKAVDEYLKGTRKKWVRTYVTDMLRRRLSIMGTPKKLEESLSQFALSAGVLLPHCEDLRITARGMWKYAEKLQIEGKQREALRIVRPWEIYVEQLTNDSNYLIEVLVCSAIAAMAEREIPQIYRHAGQDEKATAIELHAKEITDVVNVWLKEKKTHELGEKFFDKAGIAVSMFLPALGQDSWPTVEECAISNKIEYSGVEKAALAIFNLILMLGLVISSLTTLYWKYRSKQQALLLMPSLQLLGKVFLWGILIPLTAYLLISVTSLGGHEYNLGINMICLTAQLILLGFIIPGTIYMLIERNTRQRCTDLGLSVPPQKKVIFPFWAKLTLPLLVLAFVQIRWFIRPQKEYQYYLFIVIGSCLLITIAITGMKLLMSFKRKSYALYYGAVARTMSLVLALTLIFLSLLLLPALRWREAALISRDRIIYRPQANFSKPEQEVVEKLRRLMLQAINKTEAKEQ